MPIAYSGNAIAVATMPAGTSANCPAITKPHKPAKVQIRRVRACPCSMLCAVSAPSQCVSGSTRSNASTDAIRPMYSASEKIQIGRHDKVSTLQRTISPVHGSVYVERALATDSALENALARVADGTADRLRAERAAPRLPGACDAHVRHRRRSARRDFSDSGNPIHPAGTAGRSAGARALELSVAHLGERRSARPARRQQRDPEDGAA